LFKYRKDFFHWFNQYMLVNILYKGDIMQGVNEGQLMCTIVKDLKILNDNGTIGVMTVAHDKRVKNKETGQYENKTIFPSFWVRGEKNVQRISQYFKKGTGVLIEYVVDMSDTYEKEGKTVYPTVQLIIDKIWYSGSKPKPQQPQAQSVPQGFAQQPQAQSVPQGFAQQPQAQPVPQGFAQQPQAQPVPQGFTQQSQQQPQPQQGYVPQGQALVAQQGNYPQQQTTSQEIAQQPQAQGQTQGIAQGPPQTQAVPQGFTQQPQTQATPQGNYPIRVDDFAGFQGLEEDDDVPF
jgi:single-stranded DNA-binding protein